jgi:hypothetical protein
MLECSRNKYQTFFSLSPLSLPLSSLVLYSPNLRLPAVGYFKGYSKALEYEYRVKTAALSTLKQYYILSLTLYLE